MGQYTHILVVLLLCSLLLKSLLSHQKDGFKILGRMQPSIRSFSCTAPHFMTKYLITSAIATLKPQYLPIHHGLWSYNSLNFLCTALCSKNTRASKGLAGYTQSFNYAFGMFPRYFGFCGLRRKEVTALQSYLVKGQGCNIKNAINQSFFDRF